VVQIDDLPYIYNRFSAPDCFYFLKKLT